MDESEQIQPVDQTITALRGVSDHTSFSAILTKNQKYRELAKEEIGADGFTGDQLLTKPEWWKAIGKPLAHESKAKPERRIFLVRSL